MKYSRAFKWVLIILLPATLIWKLATRADDTQELKDRLVDFLVQHRFAVELIEPMMDGMPVIRASSEQCRMSVMKASALGWDWDMIRNMPLASEHVFVIFRGKILPDQPILRTLTAYAWSKLLLKFGISDHITPVIAVVASAPCNAERLPWNELYQQGVL